MAFMLVVLLVLEINTVQKRFISLILKTFEAGQKRRAAIFYNLHRK